MALWRVGMSTAKAFNRDCLGGLVASSSGADLSRSERAAGPSGFHRARSDTLPLRDRSLAHCTGSSAFRAGPGPPRDSPVGNVRTGPVNHLSLLGFPLPPSQLVATKLRKRITWEVLARHCCPRRPLSRWVLGNPSVVVSPAMRPSGGGKLHAQGRLTLMASIGNGSSEQ